MSAAVDFKPMSRVIVNVRQPKKREKKEKGGKRTQVSVTGCAITDS